MMDLILNKSSHTVCVLLLTKNRGSYEVSYCVLQEIYHGVDSKHSLVDRQQGQLQGNTKNLRQRHHTVQINRESIINITEFSLPCTLYKIQGTLPAEFHINYHNEICII